MSEQSFSKTMWDEIRDLWNKTVYEAAMLKDELKNSINLKLKLPDIQIFDVMLGYSEMEVSLYYAIVEKTDNKK